MNRGTAFRCPGPVVPGIGRMMRSQAERLPRQAAKSRAKIAFTRAQIIAPQNNHPPAIKHPPRAPCGDSRPRAPHNPARGSALRCLRLSWYEDWRQCSKRPFPRDRADLRSRAAHGPTTVKRDPATFIRDKMVLLAYRYPLKANAQSVNQRLSKKIKPARLRTAAYERQLRASSLDERLFYESTSTS